ncbi:MAG: bifunctional nuclease family protein [Muribaculaceae bacterium]|jgi:bifunctional DNase/RNase|nr:bifunctional nuclease family protein [Muribaculaceae bacterium]MBR6947367.1 bifunctional nuclease family protein [Muribaculaceae bacterium]
MENENLIALKVLGITRSEVQPGAYALLLEDAASTPDEARRIPIVVGAAEAQSIAVNLEQVMPSRPLTHDLFVSMFHAFGVELRRVTIYSFKNGVFAAMMHVSNGVTEVDIDSRTSDAIAIALRTGAPIYTTPEVMSLTSYEWRRDGNYKPQKPVRLEDLPVEKLERRLQHYVDNEEYEKAARVQKIIASKTNQPHEGE